MKSGINETKTQTLGLLSWRLSVTFIPRNQRKNRNGVLNITRVETTVISSVRKEIKAIQSGSG